MDNVSDARIRELALRAGFSLKDQGNGVHDLNPYVYTFARMMIGEQSSGDQINPTDKPILSLDFDGVINSYSSGWQGASRIPDPPVDGSMEFLRTAVQHFEVHVFSTRSREDGGIRAMHEYIESSMADYLNQLMGASPEACFYHARSIVNQIRFPMLKPKAHVGLDDRMITFNGQFPSMDELKSFKPWNR